MGGLSARLQYVSIFLTMSFGALGNDSEILGDIRGDLDKTINV